MRAERSDLNPSDLDGERMLLCPIHLATYVNEVSEDRTIVKAELSPVEEAERKKDAARIKVTKCQVAGCQKEIRWALWIYRPCQSVLPF